MEHNFTILDYAIFIVYVALIISVGLWVSRTKKGEIKTSEDYFLAGKSLTWWAIGASLIALTMILTVAVFESVTPSLTIYVNVSVPE